MNRQPPPPNGNLAHILPPSIKPQITAWLAEDIPSFDPAGFVVGSSQRSATLWAKSRGVLAGVPFVDEVFAQCDCVAAWHVVEGTLLVPEDYAPPRIRVATVTGPTNRLLQAERVALNLLARCSGIATASHDLVTHLRAAGFAGIVAGTRKTTPGFRAVEKYGMLVGGADTHRMDLSCMVMLKDNHVWAHGSIPKAVAAARAVAGFGLKIDVEVQSEAEADMAIDAGADVVMLDNFDAKRARESASGLKTKWAGQRRFLMEVSGGLTRENVAEYVSPDIDIISTSSIHQGVPHVDFSMKIVR